MTSACHGNGIFMDKPLQVGTVSFKHSKHLKHTDQDEQPTRDRLAAVTKQLEQQLGRSSSPNCATPPDRSDRPKSEPTPCRGSASSGM